MTSSFAYQKLEVLIDIENVSLSYNHIPVIKNLSATIQNIVRPNQTQGQIVGLLGPSGIGKTTLFKLLSGLVAPDTGTIRVGEAGDLVTPGQVGVVAQNYPLLNHRSVIGNLVFAAKQAGMSAVQARKAAQASLAEFSLEDHADKYPVQLSGGQRQRVAIAQQMLCSAHYLIMDEPFSGLDVVALTTVRGLLLALSQQHEENTIIVSTHDVTSAVAICDTIYLMGRDRDKSGKVIPGARVMEVFDLIELDICWHDDPLAQPAASKLIRDIKQRFLTL